MAAAVFLMRMPPGSTSGVGSVSSSSGFPGCIRTAVNPLGTVSSPSSMSVGLGDSQPRLVHREPEPVPPDHLVVGQAALQVLRDHVNVLEVALHQVALVHRSGAGGAVDGVDDPGGQANGVGGGDPQIGTLVQRQGA